MKIKIEKSVYLLRFCCKECDWVEPPDFYHGFPMPSRSICPKCGSGLTTVIGRYVYKKTSKFFGLVKSFELIDFERKE